MRNTLFQINEDEPQIENEPDAKNDFTVIDKQSYLKDLAPLTSESLEDDFSTCNR